MILWDKDNIHTLLAKIIINTRCEEGRKRSLLYLFQQLLHINFIFSDKIHTGILYIYNNIFALSGIHSIEVSVVFCAWCTKCTTNWQNSTYPHHCIFYYFHFCDPVIVPKIALKGTTFFQLTLNYEQWKYYWKPTEVVLFSNKPMLY